MHIEEEHTDDSPFVVRAIESENDDDDEHEHFHGEVEFESDSDEVSDLEEQDRPALPPRPAPEDDNEHDSGDWLDDDFRQEFVRCPESECSEVVLLVDLNEHLDYHISERTAAPSHHHHRQRASLSSRSPRRSSISNSSAAASSKPKLKGSRGARRRLAKNTEHSSASSSMPEQDSSVPSSPSAQDRPPTPPTPESTHTHNFSTSIAPALRTHVAKVLTKHRREPSPSQPAKEDEPKPRTGLRRQFKNAVRGVSSFIDHKVEKAAVKAMEPGGLRLGVCLPNDICLPPHILTDDAQYQDLGPYAFEEQMPSSIWHQLKAGPRVTRERRIGSDGRLTVVEIVENHNEGMVPRLAELSELDSTIREAWYCHPSVQHIVRWQHEGGFCGYRNIQMQISYIQGAKALGCTLFPGPRVPTIPQLQTWIEDAWDNGISELSREQIGKLKGTRKWIGTSEAHALYQQLGVQHEVLACGDERDGGRRAHQMLFDAVENYFAAGVEGDDTGKVHRTCRPPIYLQQPGHSLTIVGYEKHRNGSRNVVVFDTIFNTPQYMRAYLAGRGRRPDAEFIDRAMHIYRRGSYQLRKYKDFEILM